MPKLVFRGAEVRAVIEEAATATKHKVLHRTTTRRKTPPALWLVRKKGIYLTSNALGKKLGDPPIAHALGCDQRKDTAWRELFRDQIEGHDFVHEIVLSPSELAWARVRIYSVVIEIEPERLVMTGNLERMPDTLQ